MSELFEMHDKENVVFIDMTKEEAYIICKKSAMMAVEP